LLSRPPVLLHTEVMRRHQSVHPVTGARATYQRPCAQDLRPGGAGSTAELLRREMANANWQVW
jgi:hypothetical protein